MLVYNIHVTHDCLGICMVYFKYINSCIFLKIFSINQEFLLAIFKKYFFRFLMLAYDIHITYDWLGSRMV